MDCDKTRELFSEYYDGALNGDIEESLNAHLESCQTCAEEYSEYKSLFDGVKALPEPEVPNDLHGKIMSAVKICSQAEKRTEAYHKASGRRPFFYAFGGVAACFILISFLITAAADISDSFLPLAQVQVAQTEGAIEEPMLMYAESGSVFGAADAVQQDAPSLKSVGTSAGILKMSAYPADTSELLAAGYYSQTFNISVTVDDFQSASEAINALSGYSVSSNADFNDYGSGGGRFNRRIDVANYSGAKETLRQLGTIENESENTEKLADSIYDLEARLKAKENECARLLELLEQSKSMEVMIAVENQYANANAAKESYMGKLNLLYNQALYPYLDITVNERPPEPAAIPEKTYLQRLNESFIHSINGFTLFMESAAIFITSAAVPLLIIAVLLTVWLLLKRRKRFKGSGLLLIFALFALIGCGSQSETTAESVQMPAAAPVQDEAYVPGYGRDDYISGEVAYEGDSADYAPAPAAEAPAAEPMPMPTAPPEDGGADWSADAVGEKILKTGYVNLKTDTFDQTVDSIRSFALASGGFIERSNVYQNGSDYNNNPLRFCDITLRVPREMFDGVLQQVEDIAVLESSSQNSEDVTAQYYDLTGRLETKLLEEERVLDMIARAVKIDDLLALETRLGEIRTQIEVYQSQINNIDRLSAYSTINVTVRETPTEELIAVSEDLGGRLRLAFIRSFNNTAVFFQNVLLFLAEVFIPLLFIVFLGIVGLVIYKRKKRKVER